MHCYPFERISQTKYMSWSPICCQQLQNSNVRMFAQVVEQI